MDRKKHFEHYNSRFMWEAILKSLLVGLSVGFALNFIAALVTWFLPFNGFWIMIAALAAGVLISMPIFYFKAFRPTVQSNARRIDRYGLEERLITMVEFENEDSYMLQAQRADAQAALSAMDSKRLKVTVPGAILLAVSFVYCWAPVWRWSMACPKPV